MRTLGMCYLLLFFVLLVLMPSVTTGQDHETEDLKEIWKLMGDPDGQNVRWEELPIISRVTYDNGHANVYLIGSSNLTRENNLTFAYMILLMPFRTQDSFEKVAGLEDLTFIQEASHEKRDVYGRLTSSTKETIVRLKIGRQKSEKIDWKYVARTFFDISGTEQGILGFAMQAMVPFREGTNTEFLRFARNLRLEVK